MRINLVQHRFLYLCLLGACGLLSQQPCAAQTQAGTGAKTAQQAAPAPTTLTPQPSSAKSPVINVNLDLNTFSDYLPFDVDFTVAGNTNDKVPIAEIIQVDCWYTDQAKQTALPTDANELKKWKHLTWVNHQNSNTYSFLIPALKPNRYYSFVFVYQRALNDTEKPKLTTYAQTIIWPVISKKANEKDFEFSDQEITTIVQSIETKLSTFLNHDGLAVQWDNIDTDHYRALFGAIHKISDAYETARLDRQALELNILALKKQDTLLVAFKHTFTASHPNTADNQKILLAIDTLHRMVYKLFTYPKDPIASDALVSKAYTDACAAIAGQVKKVNLPADPNFKPIGQSITELAGAISYKYSAWVSDIKTAQSVSTDQLNSFIDAVSISLYNDAKMNGTSVNGDFTTRANTHFSADLGIAVLPGIAKLSPYIGTNIYFRPINTNRPLSWKDDDQFGKRFSLVIGVTVASLAKTNFRADLLGSNFNLLTGFGFRLSDLLHISAGTVWYSKVNANPLITNTTVGVTPYISLSLDLRIKTALNTLFGSSLSSVQ